MTDPHFTLPNNPALMVLSTQGEEVLRIEATRTVYRGAEIHDAGEVHRALLSVLTGFMPGWQPIETAPMTGDEVLVWDRAGRIYEVARWECDRWRSGLDDEHVQPTHWMPLPPPPGK